MKIWIAGFGNEHREDDAAGVILAGRIYRFLSRQDGTDVFLCREHQLLPELAIEMEDMDLAVFCDADAERHEEGFSIRGISPKNRLEGFNIHSMGPEWLLALTERIGCAPPPALLITVSGERFDFSEIPTDTCMRRIEKAEAAFRAYWKKADPRPGFDPEAIL